MCFLINVFVFCFGTEIGTENREFSLVLVPNTEILVPWQHYTLQLEKCIWKKLNMNSYFEECLFIFVCNVFFKSSAVNGCHQNGSPNSW